MNFRMPSNLSNTPQDPLYRRVQFLWSLLWVMGFTFFVLGSLNYALNEIEWLAFMHWGTSALSFLLIFWLRRIPQHSFYVAWVVLFSSAAVLIAYIVALQGQDYSLFWLALYPPVAFFLSWSPLGAHSQCHCRWRLPHLCCTVISGMVTGTLRWPLATQYCDRFGRATCSLKTHRKNPFRGLSLLT